MSMSFCVREDADDFAAEMNASPYLYEQSRLRKLRNKLIDMRVSH